MVARTMVARTAPGHKPAPSSSVVKKTVANVVGKGGSQRAQAHKAAKAAVATNAEKLAAVRASKDRVAVEKAIDKAVEKGGKVIPLDSRRAGKAVVALPSDPDAFHKLVIDERAAVRRAKAMGKPAPATPACDALNNGTAPVKPGQTSARKAGGSKQREPKAQAHPLVAKALAAREAAGGKAGDRSGRMTDDEIVAAIEKAHKARPETSMVDEFRIFRWLDHSDVSISRGRWDPLWAHVVEGKARPQARKVTAAKKAPAKATAKKAPAPTKKATSTRKASAAARKAPAKKAPARKGTAPRKRLTPRS